MSSMMAAFVSSSSSHTSSASAETPSVTFQGQNPTSERNVVNSLVPTRTPTKAEGGCGRTHVAALARGDRQPHACEVRSASGSRAQRRAQRSGRELGRWQGRPRGGRSCRKALFWCRPGTGRSGLNLRSPSPLVCAERQKTHLVVRLVKILVGGTALHRALPELRLAASAAAALP